MGDDRTGVLILAVVAGTAACSDTVAGLEPDDGAAAALLDVEPPGDATEQRERLRTGMQMMRHMTGGPHGERR